MYQKIWAQYDEWMYDGIHWATIISFYNENKLDYLFVFQTQQGLGHLRINKTQFTTSSLQVLNIRELELSLSV